MKEAIVNKQLRVLAAVIAAVVQVLGQQSSSAGVRTKGSAAHTIHVQGRGCVRPAKQEGCFVVHDIRAHRYYDVSFDAVGTTPNPYTAIWFEGIGYHHDALCSQGQPVHVSHWKPLAQKCSQPANASSTTK